MEPDAAFMEGLVDIVHLSLVDATSLCTVLAESKETPGPSSLANPSSLDLPVRVDENYLHFFNFSDYLAEHPYMRPPREYRPAKTSMSKALSDRSQSHISEDYVHRL